MPDYLPKHSYTCLLEFGNCSVLAVTYLFGCILGPSGKRPIPFTHTGTHKQHLLRKHKHQERENRVTAAADHFK